MLNVQWISGQKTEFVIHRIVVEDIETLVQLQNNFFEVSNSVLVWRVWEYDPEAIEATENCKKIVSTWDDEFWQSFYSGTLFSDI